eukprot:12045520-Ditylum_brightwellii.AAC.1
MPDSARNSARLFSSRLELKSTVSATSAPSFFHFLMRESILLFHALHGFGSWSPCIVRRRFCWALTVVSP